MAFSPDGRRLASSSGNPDYLDKPGEVKIWDTANGQEMLVVKKHTAFVTSLSFSPDGHRLATAGNDKTIQIWDARPPENRGEKGTGMAPVPPPIHEQ